MVLPRGIGIVRVNTPGRPLVWVSDRLTTRETLIARAIAYVLSEKGERIVVLKETTIALAELA